MEKKALVMALLLIFAVCTGFMLTTTVATTSAQGGSCGDGYCDASAGEDYKTCNVDCCTIRLPVE